MKNAAARKVSQAMPDDAHMIVSRDGTRKITVEEFDRMFDDGEDIDDFMDWSKATRPNLVPKRVNVDFPTWMVNALDREAKRIGITRQALIKLWIAARLESEKAKATP
jgi:hypothetical protein